VIAWNEAVEIACERGIRNELSSLQQSSRRHHPGILRRKDFRCPSCGEYDISYSVYEPGALNNLAANKRHDALDRAKIQAGYLGPPATSQLTIFEWLRTGTLREPLWVLLDLSGKWN
jgi:hypothetical protein